MRIGKMEICTIPFQSHFRRLTAGQREKVATVSVFHVIRFPHAGSSGLKMKRNIRNLNRVDECSMSSPTLVVFSPHRCEVVLVIFDY